MREFYAYVWRSSASRQIILIILAIAAALLAMAPLELQRHIINTLAGHEKADRLAWLCGAYLIAALSIGGLKYLFEYQKLGPRRVDDPLPAPRHVQQQLAPQVRWYARRNAKRQGGDIR
jgi:hypothetical protein